MNITPIPALRDNYIWMITNAQSHRAWVVDPGEARPVIQTLQKHQLQLAGILITHHHWDHTQGITELVKQAPTPVYGPTTLTEATHPLKAGDHLSLEDPTCEFDILEIPGHTLDHIAYVGHDSVFSGDTLFTAGCGRIFEGTAAQMYESLQALSCLPANTKVYCGHEYTESNLQFAQIVEPNNLDVQTRLKQVQQQRIANQPTVPARLDLEHKTNPFLRCDQMSVIKSASAHHRKPLSSPTEVLAEIRAWKNAL